MTQGEKLKAAREKYLPTRLTQAAMDERLGVKEGRTSKYEQGPGPRGISRDYQEAWEREFGAIVPWSWIEDPEAVPPPGFRAPNPGKALAEEDLAPDDEPPVSNERGPYLLPYYGDVPAGDFEEDDTFKPGYEKVEAEMHHPDRFIRKIAGDSMKPALRFGDRVIFHKSKQPRDGVIVLAQNGSGRTVKVARFRPEHRDWVLEAFNSDFTMPLTEWEMLGYLVVVRRQGLGGLLQTFQFDQGIKPEMLPKE